jgi:hypothetical protein
MAVTVYNDHSGRASSGRCTVAACSVRNFRHDSTHRVRGADTAHARNIKCCESDKRTKSRPNDVSPLGPFRRRKAKDQRFEESTVAKERLSFASRAIGVGPIAQ